MVVITGAGSGIGRALGVQLAEAGARLAFSDINEADLQDTLKRLAPSTDSRAYRAHVAAREQVFAHADEVLHDFGAVHHLVNNAGATLVGSVANTDIDEYEWLLDINLYSVLYGIKAFLPLMQRQYEGCIIIFPASLVCSPTPPERLQHIQVRGARPYRVPVAGAARDRRVQRAYTLAGSRPISSELAGA